MAPPRTESNAKAALDFFLQLSKDELCESITFSPINLAVALKLLLSGARGHTAAELGKNALDCECEKPEGVHNEFHKILAQLDKQTTNYELSFANQLYGDKSIAFIQPFLFCALKLYLTDINGVDFHNAPEEVRRLINLWVEVQTHGKIKDLLPQVKDEIACQIDLLLVNALYFKGQWEVQFDKKLTKESPLYLNERDCKTVKLMHYKMGTIEVSQVQARLEDIFTYEKLLEWTCETRLKVEEVEVAIPKIKIEKSILVLNFLEALGLNDVSDPEKADLSGITTTEAVALSEIVHGAALEINEDGGKEPPHCPREGHHVHQACVQFVADHPFLFFVLHNCSNSILFLGRFVKPKEKKDCH
ncbi:leukocyte elastase inhibitor-like [Rhineura floridana]|uniref:leukocyte elastase inhibitor-like n=1 Tax=Rhineura floridana TaxID=261503 RepID=UPI002AC837A0|nr:leukocyte elastase inhibitor-like [Rhineura floridana]